MIDRKEILDIINGYDLNAVKVGLIASHSALDVCDGAVDEGFETIAICQRGREKSYANYFRAQRDANGNIVRGIVDKPVIYNSSKK